MQGRAADQKVGIGERVDGAGRVPPDRGIAGSVGVGVGGVTSILAWNAFTVVLLAYCYIATPIYGRRGFQRP